MPDRIDIRKLRQEVTIEHAWQNWDGFVTLAGGHRSAEPKVRLVEGSAADPWQFAQQHCTTDQTDTIGCQFFRNVTFAGVLYPFINDRLIDDGSHLSRVSANWLDQYPQHRPGGSENRPLVSIEEPALALAGPGHQTYGHWIIDFLPRVALARAVLKERFGELRFLILSDTPQWARNLLRHFFGIEEDRLVAFEFAKDEILCQRLCHPTYAHSYPFFLHSFLAEFYRSTATGEPGGRRLCVSRRSNGSGRSFLRRDEFEAQARSEGYEVVDPQILPISDQIGLFRSAAVIIGEYGSALHNSVFSGSSTIFGVLNAPGVEQTRLCAAFGQQIAFVIGSNDGSGGSWSLTDEQLASFFNTVRRMATPRTEASFKSDTSSALRAEFVASYPWSFKEIEKAAPPQTLHLTGNGGVAERNEFQAKGWTLADGKLILLDTLGRLTATFTERLDVGDATLLCGCRTGTRSIFSLQSLENEAGHALAPAGPWIGEFTKGHEMIRNLAEARLRIGKFCTIDGDVSIVATRFDPNRITTYGFPEPSGSSDKQSAVEPTSCTGVTLGHDVRIGHGVIIRAGVTIDDGAIVEAGSVVTRDVPAYAVVEGNPASIVCYRFSPDQITRLTATAWWDWPESKLVKLQELLSCRDVEIFLAASAAWPS